MPSDAPIPPGQPRIAIELSHAQALVLFGFLSRFSEDDALEIVEQAEARVLWDLCCDLENVLVEPLRADFLEQLQQARNRVRDAAH